MALKAFIKKLEDVAEPLRALYVETDDGFLLDVDDKDYKAKLDEFRGSNRELTKVKKDLEAQVAKFKDIDPAKYTEALEALAKIEQLEDAKLLKEGKLEEVIKRRTATTSAQYENQLKAKDDMIKSLSTENNDLSGRFGDLVVETQVAGMINGLAVPRRGAMGDILSRARRTWKADKTGKLVTEQVDSKGNPITLEDWGKQLVQDASFLFEPGQGGGAAGGNKGQGQGGTRILANAGPEDFGANLEAIAQGKVTVAR